MPNRQNIHTPRQPQTPRSDAADWCDGCGQYRYIAASITLPYGELGDADQTYCQPCADELEVDAEAVYDEQQSNYYGGLGV